MPLLKRGPEVFPQGLFDLRETDLPWAVAHTRSRQEKVFARHLESLGVPFYLPQHEHRVVRAGRSFFSYIPLFPGYVFLRPSAAQRVEASRNKMVVRLLEVRNQSLLNRELRELRSLQEAGAALVPYRAIVPGDSVSVVEGPFRGYTGKVLREQSRLRLIVSISILNQRVSVEFDRACLVSENRSAVA